MATDLSQVYEDAGKAFNVDPGLLRAISGAESNDDPNAVSSKGALGHMQIMPATALGLAVNPLDATQAIWGAANLMSQNLQATGGNVPDALRMYNAGPDRSRWGNPETMAYVDRVAANYPQQQPQSVSQTEDPFAGSGSVDSAPAAASTSPAQKTSSDAYSTLFGGSSAANATPAPAAANNDKADPYASLFGQSDPHAGDPAKASWHQGSWLSNAAGIGKTFVEGAGQTIDKGLLGVVNAIPGVRSELVGTGLDPARLAPADQQLAQDAAATPGGQTAAAAGGFTANALTGAAAGEGAGAALGAGGNALAAALGGGAGRVIQGATNLLTGTSSLGKAGNLLSSATSGAAKAAVGSVAANGGMDGIGTNALIGGVAGPATMAVAPAARYVGNALARGGNALLDVVAPASEQATPRVVNDLAPAQMPASASSPNASPSPDPAPASDAAPAAQAAPQTPPEAVSLGLFSSPEDGDKLAKSIYDSYTAGGSTQLVQSKIPGVQLTAAQATGNPGLALLERNRRAANPNAFTALDQQNAAARNAYAQQVIGTPEQLETARVARDDMDAQARPQVFGSQQPVAVAPILDDVNAAISANKGRPTVQAPLQNVASQLQAVAGEDGTAMPADLWNVRKYLNDMVAPRAAGTANDGQAAAAQLSDLKPTIDATIEQGAPGFQDYLQQYQQMSRPIDAMEYLQGKFPTDAQGNIQLGRLDTFIKGINRAQNKSGISQADSITDQQLQALTDLRDDMRLSSRIDLGKARGSDTNINLMTTGKVANMMQGATPKVASVMTGLGGALAGHPIEGGAIGLAANYAANRLASAQVNRIAAVRAASEQALDNRLLNPYGR